MTFLTVQKSSGFYADFIDEEIRLAGVECLYIPKSFTSFDKILGEPYQTLYNRYFPIPGRLTDMSGYGGNGDLMSQMGIRSPQTCEIIFSKRIFRNLKIPDRPMACYEGDLILIGPSLGMADYKNPQFTSSIFEIVYAHAETPNWPLGRTYVFQVSCQLYVSSYEKFDTKNKDIDKIDLQANNQAELVIGINKNLEEAKTTLVAFDEQNPFSGL